jgi:hypothetical protein
MLMMTGAAGLAKVKALAVAEPVRLVSSSRARNLPGRSGTATRHGAIRHLP